MAQEQPLSPPCSTQSASLYNHSNIGRTTPASIHDCSWGTGIIICQDFNRDSLGLIFNSVRYTLSLVPFQILLITVKTRLLASVGLRVSGSHDLGEIACEIACSLMLFAACYCSILFIDYTIYARGGSGDEIIM